MEHPVHRVVGFERVGTYTLRVRFEDRTEQVVDFEPVLHGQLFGPLREPEEFSRVGLDEEVGTLVWPSGADFDPAMLHDWPEVAEEFAERARSWDSVPAGDRRPS
jgi:hypothetical protein